MSPTDFIKCDNVSFWALIELIEDAATDEELDRCVRHLAEIELRITRDQYDRLVRLGKLKRQLLSVKKKAR